MYQNKDTRNGESIPVLHPSVPMQIAAAGLDGWAFLEFRRLLLRIFSVIGVRGGVMSWVKGPDLSGILLEN